jgi:multicomponent Na+:H+ antiporter subunit B
MRRYERNPIPTLISVIITPVIMLFALYIIFHGHYSPGGGFQGGTMLAAGIILIRLVFGNRIGQMHFDRRLSTPLGALGVFIYFVTGLSAMFFGSRFLDYQVIPLASEAFQRRSLGILLVEIGVGLAVMAILVGIFDDLLEGRPDD